MKPKLINKIVLEFYEDGSDHCEMDLNGKQMAYIIGFLKHEAYKAGTKEQFELIMSVSERFFESIKEREK